MSRHRSLRALLVDVPPGHATLLERALDDAGWRVRAERVDGTDALTAALQRRGWQAILYGGDGHGSVPARKALALVRLADPHLPFIAVSPYVHRGDLAAVVRGLPGSIPTVSDPARLPRVLGRALEQTRLRRRVGSAHRLLLAQQAITDHLAAGLDTEEVCARVLATLGETLGWAVGAVWRPAADASVLRCASVWHAPGARQEVAEFAAATPSMTFAPGQGLAGRVWAFRRPAWVADVAQDRNMPRAAPALRAGLLTAVAFPIVLADECAGVIEFFSGGIHEPNAEVAAMFATVGGQLAQYLANHRAQPRAHLDDAAALVVALDTDGRVELANRRACELLGSAEEALLGRDWFALAVPEPARDAARADFTSLLAGEHGEALATAHPVSDPPRDVAWRWAVRRGVGSAPMGVLAWGEPAGVS